jgi:hypothetical protein
MLAAIRRWLRLDIPAWGGQYKGDAIEIILGTDDFNKVSQIAHEIQTKHNIPVNFHRVIDNCVMDNTLTYIDNEG